MSPPTLPPRPPSSKRPNRHRQRPGCRARQQCSDRAIAAVAAVAASPRYSSAPTSSSPSTVSMYNTYWMNPYDQVWSTPCEGDLIATIPRYTEPPAWEETPTSHPIGSHQPWEHERLSSPEHVQQTWHDGETGSFPCWPEMYHWHDFHAVANPAPSSLLTSKNVNGSDVSSNYPSKHAASNHASHNLDPMDDFSAADMEDAMLGVVLWLWGDVDYIDP